ncbi:MAG: hypothetical protein HFJ45_04015 [Clostridia bacterium]|nr:hypothetical protein [Clostridia bacterium]
MGNIQYFILGAVLGVAISLYIFASREEKIEKEIFINKRLFSSKNLDKSLEKAVNLMKMQIKSLNRELTEEEKDNIIYKCYMENNPNNNDNQINA